MAKHGKVLPARRSREEEDSILLRSAETIGRVIGTLQRQLDGTRGRLAEFVLDEEISGNGHGKSRSKPKTAGKNSAKARKAISTAKDTGAARRKKKTARTVKATRTAASTAARKGAKR